MYKLREKIIADIIAIYDRDRELFRPPTYFIPDSVNTILA